MKRHLIGNNKNILTFAVLTIASLFFTGITIALWYFPLNLTFSHNATVDATPLSSVIVADLCDRNLVPQTIADCDQSDVQIFRKDVNDIFQENLRESATYPDAHRLFGRYEWSCGDRNTAQYTCDYTLGMRIRFDTESNQIIEMTWTGYALSD